MNGKNIQIYPPIIDNTIGAFPIHFNTAEGNRAEGELKVQFYFQIPIAETEESKIIRKDKVLVNAQIGGESILKGTYKICDCTPPQDSDILTSTNYADKAMYSIILNQNDLKENFSFAINTPIQISLAALTTDTDNKLPNEGESLITWYDNLINEDATYLSAWSDKIIKYAITQPTFKVWGGVNADEVIAPETFQPQENDSRLLKTTNYNTQYFSQDVYRIRGELSFANNIANPNINEDDVLLWYQIEFYRNGKKVFDNGEALPSTNGRAYPNRFWDISNRKFYYEFAEDSFSDFEDGEKIEMAVLYATSKGYKETFIYPIIVSSNNESTIVDSTLSWKETQITATQDSEKGCIRVSATLYNSSTITTGIFYCQRAVDNGNGVLNYKTIYKRTQILTSEQDTPIFYDDYSAEAGVLYQYKFFFRHESLNEDLQPVLKYSAELETSEPALLLIEDMFLITKGIKLKIRYNPEVTSYKRNVQDIVTPTLGGAYPFVRRNGAQVYKTFTIGGLISYHGEESEYGVDWLPHILSVDSQEQQENKEYPDIFGKSMFMPLKDLLGYTFPKIPKGLSYYDSERIKEKLFRDSVMDFLYSGEVMLFKSLPEGNSFVKLTNISFTSNKQLDRNIYSFTAQAVEVMAPSAENYSSYFSDEDLIASYILTRVYLKTDGVSTSDITSLLNVSVPSGEFGDSLSAGTLRVVKSTINYKIDSDSGWTNVIDSTKTYLDKFGRVVPVINGNFAPGRYPEIQIENKSSKIQEIKDRSVNVYRQTYEFDDE